MMSESKRLSATFGSHNFNSTSNSNMSQKQPLQDSRSSDKSLRTPFFAIQQPSETFPTYNSPRKQQEIQQISLVNNQTGPNSKQRSEGKENIFKSELMGKGKLKSEKSYRDLNKSLANLARSPDSFTSLSDPNFQYQSISSNYGPKVPSFQFQPFSDQAKKNPRALYEKKLSHPVNIKRDFEKSSFATFNKNENFYTQQKEKHHQARTGVSNVELPSRIRDISPGLPKYPYSSNMNHKYLLTEGDSPTGRDDFLEARFSENLTQRIQPSKYQKAPQDPNKFTLKNPEEIFKELSLGVTENSDKRKNTVTEEDKEQEKFITTHMTSSNLTPSFVSIPQSKKSKMVTQESLKEETIFHLKNRMNNEDHNNGQLDLNSISEGVQYTLGGCGYGDQKKSGKSSKSNEKINKETFRSWKKDLQKIQEEMNRRKGSYEKVNKFLNMCDDINNEIQSPPSVQSIDEGSPGDGFDSQRHRQSQIASLTPKISRDIPNSSTYSPLNSTVNATRNLNKSNNGQISDRDRSFERQIQPIITFSDLRITEGEEQRYVYENNIIQELDEQPIPQRRIHDVNLNSFVCGHENCNKCVRAPCCGRNSNCQIF